MLGRINFKTDADHLKSEATAALQEIRKVAAESGVTQQAKYFNDAQSDYRNDSHIWMGLTAAFMAVLFAFVWWVFKPEVDALPSNVSTARIVQLSIPKIFLASLLYFGMVWAARNYAACRHNQVVNEHRLNALRTFQEFVTGAADQRIKDAILLQASACVFNPQVSGYLKDQSVPQEHNSVVEIVKSATDKSA